MSKKTEKKSEEECEESAAALQEGLELEEAEALQGLTDSLNTEPGKLSWGAV